MKNLSTALTRFIIGIAVTLLFSALLLKDPMVLQMLEAKLLDIRFRVRDAVKAPDSVVIAAIDEKSLDKLGRWPWGRDVMARLVDKLAAADAAVIAFDIIFPEPDKNDPQLAASIQNAGNVILPMAFDFEHKSKPVSDPVLENSSITSITETELFKKYLPLMSGGTLTVPAKQLEVSAMSLGHINMFPDEFDGTLRWEALYSEYDGALYPSLGLRSAAAYLGVPGDKLTVAATTGVKVGKIFVPSDHYGRMPINYYGPGKTFKHISIADILDGTVGSKELDNRIVLLGTTAIGIYDLRVTPFSAAMPGVEKHAAVAASIIENRFIYRVAPWQDLIFLLAGGILFSLLLGRVRVVVGAALTLVMMLVIAMAGYYLFKHSGLWFNLAGPLLNISAIFMTVTAWNYAFEERRARSIRAMFSSYVTQAIVNELILNPDMAKLGGERREITVMFSDVAGFTSLSEQHSPEEVVAVLNEYLGAMTDVILKWEGTLDKFIGDAIMVFWNAPVRKANHAELAVRCALEMQTRLVELQNKWEKEGTPRLSAGIGINTGEAVVGNIGAEGKKMDYTIIGDQVNLGSRVESLTRKFKTPVLITDGTVKALQPVIDAGGMAGVCITGLQRVIVKGKELPVTLYSADPLEAPAQQYLFTECPEGEVLKLTEK